MKWKYNATSDEKEDFQQPTYIIAGPSTSGGNAVRVVENNVYFYGDVTENNALDLNATLFEVDKKLSMMKSVIDCNPKIHLHINSYGGSLFAGLATVDVIRKLNNEVHSHIEGAAASAATIISVSCNYRTIGKYSKMLIHQLSSGMYGKYTELEDDMENNKHLMQTIKSIYKEFTKVPMKKIDEILKHDLWFDSTTCLELGLVDEIK